MTNPEKQTRVRTVVDYLKGFSPWAFLKLLAGRPLPYREYVPGLPSAEVYGRSLWQTDTDGVEEANLVPLPADTPIISPELATQLHEVGEATGHTQAEIDELIKSLQN